MLGLFKKKEVTAKTMLKLYRRLQRTPSGERRAKRHLELRSLMRLHQDLLYELVFSGEVSDDRELLGLIALGGSGGSVRKEDNQYWIPFLKRINERRSELPELIGSYLDALGDRGYWDDEGE